MLVTERLIAGVDEAGRGPLAGPVVAAAVDLDPRRRIPGLKDSKQLTPARRESLAEQIRARALCWALGWSECHEIDALNILEATHLAMRRALLGLAVMPRSILVDGNRLPCLADLAPGCPTRAIIKGDCTEPAISARLDPGEDASGCADAKAGRRLSRVWYGGAQGLRDGGSSGGVGAPHRLRHPSAQFGPVRAPFGSVPVEFDET